MQPRGWRLSAHVEQLRRLRPRRRASFLACHANRRGADGDRHPVLLEYRRPRAQRRPARGQRVLPPERRRRPGLPVDGRRHAAVHDARPGDPGANHRRPGLVLRQGRPARARRQRVGAAGVGDVLEPARRRDRRLRNRQRDHQLQLVRPPLLADRAGDRLDRARLHLLDRLPGRRGRVRCRRGGGGVRAFGVDRLAGGRGGHLAAAGRRRGHGHRRQRAELADRRRPGRRGRPRAAPGRPRFR